MSDQNHPLPPHLVPLIPPDWGLWKWFVLRGAGFPARLAGLLSGKECAMAADRLASCDAALQALNQQAAHFLSLRLDVLKQDYGWKDARFKAAVKARRRAQAGRLTAADGQEYGMAPLLEEIEKARDRRAQCLRDFEGLFNESLKHQSRQLWEVARDPLFQEAVLWQNRHGFETGIQPLAVQPAPAETRNQKQREREQLIANYLQRYCLKNDTIGFFGPVAWGEITATGPALVATPGPALVSTRHAYFEDWAINRLAETLSSIPGIEWWCTPRLAPHFRLENGMLHAPGAEPAELTLTAQAVLPLCDGDNLPEDILCALEQSACFADVGKPELLDFLKTMSDQGILLWRFLVPVEVNSEISLRRQLLRIQDQELRQAALEKLDRLESSRQEVNAAAGDTERLHSALRALEQLFEDMTLTPGQRNAGTTYGGRTLVYEDCRRDLTLSASPNLFRPVVPPLSLLLRSLRWLMQSTSLTLLGIFREVCDELAGPDGRKDIPAPDWWMAAEPRLAGNPALDEAQSLFLRKWEEIMPLSADVPTVEFRSEELRERVEHAFPDLPGHYHPVRYYCPDMLIAGSDPESIARGEALYVLGEMHSGKNSLIHTALAEQHPNPELLSKATEWDLSPGCFKIAESREGRAITRTSERILRSADYFLSTTPDAMPPDGFKSHPFSGLLVTEWEGRLMVTTRDGSRSFEILEAFSDLLFSFVVHRGSWMPRLRHLPRVLIDRLVVQRETWRIPAAEPEFVAEKDDARRFLEARRWAKKHSMPDAMFVKVPVEVKPFYVDLSSPVYVEILCKMVRRLQSSSLAEKEITFSEMLPRATDAWLPDGGGEKYTSEFRIAMVDLKARLFSEEYKKRYAHVCHGKPLRGEIRASPRRNQVCKSVFTAVVNSKPIRLSLWNCHDSGIAPTLSAPATSSLPTRPVKFARELWRGRVGGVL